MKVDVGPIADGMLDRHRQDRRGSKHHDGGGLVQLASTGQSCPENLSVIRASRHVPAVTKDEPTSG
jgi:hypothetical protein